jgi:hypothetical protein
MDIEPNVDSNASINPSTIDPKTVENFPGSLQASRAHARPDGEPSTDFVVGSDGAQKAATKFVEALADEPSSVGRGRIPLDDPRKLELQHRAYQLYVDGRKSKTEIAHVLALDRGTVAAYIVAEAERRVPEFEALRKVEIQRSLTIYDAVTEKYLERMDQADARGDEGRYIIQARERYDALLGLDAPKKLDTVNQTTATIVAELSTTDRANAMRMASARRRIVAEGSK